MYRIKRQMEENEAVNSRPFWPPYWFLCYYGEGRKPQAAARAPMSTLILYQATKHIKLELGKNPKTKPF